MELSGSNIRKFLIFSQNKPYLILLEMECFYVLGNGKSPKRFSYFLKIKLLLYFGKQKPKKLILFQEELPKPQNQNFLYFSKKSYK